ncbi:hypothetical protein CWI38_0681p0020 [Hamiltosporidium tvaerminnensis]|uniref:Ankyrin repeat-containing protein n=1 Tax=Hamiltosporidium tvaerminnensis TaxID=1176355 RepID=A0A4Q9LVM7_9MICR|nr:hypothetical protein CWI38_0681p0020 [Hamiltosporidium tvaerminnensis]
MEFYKFLDELDHRKIILTLEKEKHSGAKALINTPYKGTMYISCLGEVKRMNAVQYLIGRMIQNNYELSSVESTNSRENSSDINDELFRAIMILLRKSDKDVLNYEDSGKNNVLHYCAVLGNYDMTKFVLESGVNISKNGMSLYAYSVCENKKTENLLKNWTKNREKAGKISEERIELEKDFSNYKKIKISSSDSLDSTLADKCESTNEQKSFQVNISEKGAKPEPGTNNFEQVRKTFDFSSVEDTFYLRGNIKSRTELDDGYKVVHLDTENALKKKIHENVTNEITIKRFPGKLFFYLQSINECLIGWENVDLVLVKINVNDKIFLTREFSPNKNILINQMFIIEIPKKQDVNIKLTVLIKERNNEKTKYSNLDAPTRKIAIGTQEIKTTQLINYHNKIQTNTIKLQKYSPGGIFEALSSLFSKELPTVSHIDTQMVILSEGEIIHVPFNVPTSFNELVSWFKRRNYTYAFWFKGYINIRGNKRNIATQLWKRRFIYWYGYSMIIYNVYSGSLIANLDLSKLKNVIFADNSDSFISTKYFKLVFDDGDVEIHIDKNDKFEETYKALYYLVDSLKE